MDYIENNVELGMDLLMLMDQIRRRISNKIKRKFDSIDNSLQYLTPKDRMERSLADSTSTSFNDNSKEKDDTVDINALPHMSNHDLSFLLYDGQSNTK